MKALFITTQTRDCANHVRAWDSLGEPAIHAIYDYGAINNGWQFLEVAERHRPEIIFWIGAASGPGNPKPDTLRRLRTVASTVNLVSDAADPPWHEPLRRYRQEECFDLQVALDGATDAPVDMTTLTPIDSRPFEVCAGRDRDIRCGFSGSVGRWSARADIIKLIGEDLVTVRQPRDGYDAYAAFLHRCQMLLNTSFTGSEATSHIKGRVLEAGWAGCALLEDATSPIRRWFPEGAWFEYERTGLGADAWIRDTGVEEIRKRARVLSAHVRSYYTPARIFKEIIGRARRHHVGDSEPQQAT